MEFCIGHVRGREPERINGSVWDNDGSDKGWIYGRLHRNGFLRVNHSCLDSGLVAGLYKLRLIAEVVFRKGDEKPFCLFDAASCNLLENHILLDTFGCGFCIVHGISGTTVQQSVISSCRACRDVIPFKKQNFQPAERTISCCACARGSTTDNDDIKLIISKFVHTDFSFLQKTNLSPVDARVFLCARSFPAFRRKSNAKIIIFLPVSSFQL